MRLVLLALGLAAVAACTPQTQTVVLDDNVGLIRFIEPVNGAAWSQADVRYYTQNANGFANGANTSIKHP